MTKYPDHSPPSDALKDAPLEFQVAPDFVRVRPGYPQVMLQRIARDDAWRSQRPGRSERRLARRSRFEFVLWMA